MIRLLSVALVVCAVSPALARDWFVNNISGSDLNDGAFPSATAFRAGPVATIGKALRHADHYDRILIANTGEPYRESLSLGSRHSGQPLMPFTIIGNGAVIDGSQPVPDDAWEHYRGEVFRFEPRLKGWQMLFLEGKPLPRGKWINEDTPAPLAPLEYYYHHGYVYFRPEPGRLPQHYGLTQTGLPVGITIYQAMHVDIQDLVIQGFQLDGVNAHDSAFSVRLVGLTARGNARSGISIGGSSQVIIEACLAGDNGAAQVRTEGWSHTRLINCTLLKNSAPPLVKTEHSQVREIVEDVVP